MLQIELVRQYAPTGSGQQRRLRREGGSRHRSRTLSGEPGVLEPPDGMNNIGVDTQSHDITPPPATFNPRLSQRDESAPPNDRASQSQDPIRTSVITPRLLTSLPFPPWANNKEPAKNSKPKASDWEKQVEDRVLSASYRYEVKILTEDPFPGVEDQIRWSEEVWMTEFDSQPQWALTDRIRSYVCVPFLSGAEPN